MTATWVRESKRIECLMITLLTIFWLVHLAPVMNNRRQESSRRHFCLRQLECLQRPGNVRFWIINSASLLPTSQLEKFYESFMQKRSWKHDDGMGVLIEWTKLWAKLLLYWYIRIWCLMSIMCHLCGYNRFGICSIDCGGRCVIYPDYPSPYSGNSTCNW